MNKILLAAVLAASAVMSGCTEKQDAHPSVKIVPTIKTRVSGLHFDDGDQIGLTILKGEQSYAENHPMTYEGFGLFGIGTAVVRRPERNLDAHGLSSLLFSGRAGGIYRGGGPDRRLRFVGPAGSREARRETRKRSGGHGFLPPDVAAYHFSDE